MPHLQPQLSPDASAPATPDKTLLSKILRRSPVIVGVLGAICMFVYWRRLNVELSVVRQLAENAPGFDKATTIALLGQTGDAFNTFNTLFTGLAFVAVAVGFWHEIIESSKRDAQHAAQMEAIQADARKRDAEHKDVLRLMSRQVDVMGRATKTDALIAMAELLRWHISGLTSKPVQKTTELSLQELEFRLAATQREIDDASRTLIDSKGVEFRHHDLP